MNEDFCSAARFASSLGRLSANPFASRRNAATRIASADDFVFGAGRGGNADYLAERAKREEELGKQKLVDLQKFKAEAKRLNSAFNAKF